MDRHDASRREVEVSDSFAMRPALAALAGGAAGALFGWGGVLAVVAAIVVVSYFLARARRAASPFEEVARPAPAAEPASPSDAESAASVPADRVDELTGLANANGLDAWFAEKAARLAADGKGLVILVAKLADLDSLAARRGQAVAEAVLKEVASRVAAVAGEEGIAARTGGGEFASVVAVVPARSEAIAAERAGHLIEMMGVIPLLI